MCGFIFGFAILFHGLPWWLSGEESACYAGVIPGFERALGEGNGSHFSILAWEIPWTEESGRL